MSDSREAVLLHPYMRTTGLLLASTAALVVGWLLLAPGRELRLDNYLPLHSLLETCSISVGVVVFVVSRITFGDLRTFNIIVLGSAFLGTAFLDFLHAASYLGMPQLVTPSSPGKAINFWLAGRFLAVGSLLFAAYASWDRTLAHRRGTLFTAGILVGVTAVSWVILYRPHGLPETFVPASGLTAFKIGCEVLIIGMSLVAAYGYFKLGADGALSRERGRRYDPAALMTASLATAASEMFMIAYTDVNGLFNVIGHIYKVIAVCFLFRGLVSVNVFEGQARSELALAAADFSAWTLDVRTRYFESDAKAAEIFGISPTPRPSVGDIDALVHPQDRHVRQTALNEALEPDGPGTYRCEYRITRPADGAQRHILSLGRTEFRDGVPVRVIGVLRDVTESRLVEERIATDKQRINVHMDNSPLGVIEFDPVFRILSWSQGAERLFGWTAAEVTGRLFEEFKWVHEDDADGVRKVVDELISGKFPRSTAHNRNYRKDGRIVHCAWYNSTIFDDKGIPVSHLSLVQDVTDRQLAEDALRESEERLRRLGDNLPDSALYQYIQQPDGTGRFTYISSGVERIFGLSVAEVIGGGNLLHQQILAPYRDKIAEANLQRARDLADSYLEFPIRRPDGEIRWIRRVSRPLALTGGAVMFHGVATDISERKRVESELEHVRHLLAEGQRISHLGSWEYIAATATTVWSDELKRIYGLDPAGPSPRYADMLRHHIHPEDASALDKSFRLAIENQATFENEHRIVRPDGGVRWIYNRAHPEFDPDGTLLRYIGASHDITDRKAAEAALAQINADLERRVSERTAALEDQMERRAEAERALAHAQRLDTIGRLAGGLTHDFNNTLAAISANLGLAQMRADNPVARESIKRALDAVDIGASLNRRLLTYARRGPIPRATIATGGQLATVIALIERTLGADIKITTQISDGLWPTYVDAGGFDGAILNLALNARDAMAAGGRLRIEGRNVLLERGDMPQGEEGKQGDYVCIAVSDNGTGMTPEVLEHVGEPFFTTKDAGSGTGLGISSVREFLSGSGGFMTIDSHVGAGTTVTLYLPRTENDASSGKPTVPEDVPLGDGEMILVVDDNPRVLEASSALIEGLGYAVATAKNGNEGLAVIDSCMQVDLVLSDIVMPGGLSGIDLARRAMALHPRVKVVLASGFHDKQLSLGDLNHITVLSKPYSRAEVARALQAALHS